MKYISNNLKYLKDHNMLPVGLRNIWILTNYAQNPPLSLLQHDFLVPTNACNHKQTCNNQSQQHFGP
jgi:hypothetical protein